MANENLSRNYGFMVPAKVEMIDPTDDELESARMLFVKPGACVLDGKSTLALISEVQMRRAAAQDVARVLRTIAPWGAR